jgi:hypothetical protein
MSDCAGGHAGGLAGEAPKVRPETPHRRALRAKREDE